MCTVTLSNTAAEPIPETVTHTHTRYDRQTLRDNNRETERQPATLTNSLLETQTDTYTHTHTSTNGHPNTVTETHIHPETEKLTKGSDTLCNTGTQFSCAPLIA